MNQQNNPSRIRAKRSMREMFKQIAAANEVILTQRALEHVDQMVDDIIQAAVDQMKADVPEEEQAGKGYAEYWHGVKPKGE